MRGYNMKINQQGFTLIELMIVVAIIGILASLAIAAFQTYTVRAQISEGLTLAGPAQAAIAEYTNDRGGYPVNNAAASLEAPASYSGNYVVSVSVTGAVISILFGNDASSKIAGETITLTATRTQGSVRWECDSGGVISANYLPSVCR